MMDSKTVQYHGELHLLMLLRERKPMSKWLHLARLDTLTNYERKLNDKGTYFNTSSSMTSSCMLGKIYKQKSFNPIWNLSEFYTCICQTSTTILMIVSFRKSKVTDNFSDCNQLKPKFTTLTCRKWIHMLKRHRIPNYL